VSMLNRLGEVVKLTGANHYIRSNSVRALVGGDIVDDAPTTYTLPAQDPTFAVTISEATQKLSITFDDSLAWANEDDGFLQVSMGSPQNPQRNFFKAPYRFAGAIAGITIGPPASPDATIDCPFVATEGQRVWVKARAILADGRVSEEFAANCFCAA